MQELMPLLLASTVAWVAWLLRERAVRSQSGELSGLPRDQSWWLYVRLPEEDRAREYPLSKLPLLIGRDARADISLPGSALSRQHARLEGRRGHFYLRDLGSTNGTTVDGLALSGGAVEVRPGQEIVLAGEVQVSLIGADGGPGQATVNPWRTQKWR